MGSHQVVLVRNAGWDLELVSVYTGLDVKRCWVDFESLRNLFDTSPGQGSSVAVLDVREVGYRDPDRLSQTIERNFPLLPKLPQEGAEARWD